MAPGTDPQDAPAATGELRPPGRQRLKLLVAYDGSGFHGFAENRGVPTVAGALRRALEKFLRHPVAITCAGRTDAGVHARGQVVTIDVRPEADLERLVRAVNSQLGPRVVVRSVERVGGDVDARFSARWRTYRYFVLNRGVPDPFLAATSWWVPTPLDRLALAEACPPLLGEQDFTTFCRRPKADPSASLVRRVMRAEWVEEEESDLLRFEITASAFCHQMVRSIVGTLVEVGRGRRTPADVKAALEARDRSGASQLAPPHGLILWRVGYDGDEPPGPTDALGGHPLGGALAARQSPPVP